MLFSGRAARAAASLLCLAAASAFATEPPHDDDHRDDEELIVVTANPLARARDDQAAAVNVLDRDHLQAHGGTTLGEALRSEPGITTSGFAPGASRPVIRGQDSFRVRVLQDGLGTHGVAEISADHGEAINPLSARRVEVVRGPATLRYGGGAIGGVVNAITNRVPLEAIDEPLRADLFGGYGSVAEDRMFAGELEGGYGPFAWHVDGMRRASDDYGLPSSSDVQDNTGTDLYAVGGGGAWVGSLGRIGIGYGRYVDDYGITEPEDPDNAPTIELESQNFDLHADAEVGLGPLDALRFRGRYTDYTHDEVVQREAASTFDADTWEGRLEALHDPVLGLSGAVGLHVLVRDLSAEGEGSELLAPAETDFLAGYFFEEVELGDALRLDLGGRVERNRVQGSAPPAPAGSGNGRSRSFTPLSGSAGLVWTASDETTLGATLSASQRAPDALELFAKGPHEADGTFQVGDPDADVETSWTAELNASGHFERVTLHGAVFYTRYQDFLFGRLTGNTCDEDGTCFPGPGGELDELLYTQEDANFAGFELEGDLPIWDFEIGQFGLDAQLDWVRAWLDDGHNVPRMPPLRWGSGVYFAGDRVRARVGFLRHERQPFQGEFETETAGYTMLDASTSLQIFGDEDRGIHLDVGVDNLNDARARNSVSFKKEDQRLPGRSVRVGLRGTF